jgi:hypothetical protein
MYLAVKTTASPAETWAIVIVAVICLAFWLIMVVAVAPRPDARKRERQQALPVPFAVTGTDAPGAAQTRDDLRSVPGQRQPAAPAPARLPAQRQSGTDEAAPSRRSDP